MIPFLRKLGWVARRRRKEDELAAELQFHLEEEAAERREAGMSAEDAAWAARRELGNLALTGEETRAAWSWTLLEQSMQDLRYGARALLRSPAFTVLAALSLALGIGANTAIYSMMDALLMRRLPVADPESLVTLQWNVAGDAKPKQFVMHDISGQIFRGTKTGRTSAVFPFPVFEELRKPNSALSILFARCPARKLNVMVRGQAELTDGEYVSGDYFRGLGIVPAAGRLITGDDDRAGAPAVAVLSFGFARARFGDAANAIGQETRIDNIPFTAIGVAPPGFFGVDPSKSPDVYLPMHANLLLRPENDPGHVSRYLDQHYYWAEMMGRLRPGVTRQQAQQALAPRFDSWIAASADNDEERKSLPKLLLQEGAAGRDTLRRSYSEPLYILLAMVGLILAVACANVANLLLARATARRREMAVRLSVGAGRQRIVRQLLTESMLLAALGGCGGVLVAVWGIRFLTGVLSVRQTLAFRPELNLGALAAALLLTLATGLLFGLAPALQATRADVLPALKDGRSGMPRAGGWFSLGRLLVVAQMAICLMLMAGAGLFVRTLANLRSLEVGFERENTLVFRVNARQAGHRRPEILSFYENLADRLAGIPGVRSAAMANSPLIGQGAWGWPVVPMGRPQPEDAPTGYGSGSSPAATHILGVGPGFFSTMRIPLIAGREFDGRSRAAAKPVAIVNEAWLKAHPGMGNPIGASITSFGMNGKAQQLEVVGVAKNTRYDDLTGEFPAIVYLPYDLGGDVSVDEMTYYLRTNGNPSGYAGAAREIVRQADARIPLAGLTTQTAQIEGEMSTETLFARLSAAFAVLSLAIACVGLYGTTSYTVARRTGEIGIRMALGAQRSALVWMVLREVLALAAAGLALSLPAALAASRLVESLLFGVKPNDPWSMAAAVAVLLGAALAAGYLPARRASRIDPLTAIRQE